MGTIELLKNMQEKCLNGGKYDDPLRMEKYQALEKAIKAIENQPKYEKTIADMAEWIKGTAEVGEYCDGCQYFDNENESCSCMMADECRAHIINYYMTNNHIGE